MYMIGVVCIGLPYEFFEDYIRCNLIGKNYVVIKNQRDLQPLVPWVFQGIFVINRVPRSYWSLAPTGVPHYLINMEQCSRRKFLQNLKQEWSTGRYTQLIDYSDANLRYYSDSMQPSIAIHMKSNTTSISKDKEYDVAFVGLMSERRSHILNKLMEQGVSVRHVCGWGRSRDAAIAGARILLNIHYSENYRIFESIRCQPWMGREDILVISEDSEPDFFTPWLITLPYDQLVQKTIEALQDPTGFHRGPLPPDHQFLI